VLQGLIILNETIQPAADFSPNVLVQLLNDAFANYIAGPVRLDRSGLAGMIAREGIDLFLSRVLVQNDTPLGFILIARQGWTDRIAVMGMIPKAQQQGLGRMFLTRILEEAKLRGERTLVLEAFEQNLPAVSLYKRVGFEVVERLYGYSADHIQPVADDRLCEIDIVQAANRVVQYGEPMLPWQISGPVLTRLGSPNRAYQLDHACAIISDPTHEAIYVRALIVEPEHRRQGYATRLLKALAAIYSGKKWSITPTCPERIGEPFFPEIGFTRNELHQVLMVCDLTR
jgi:ribosomal protein S18 acetylase RimI-like enzyme